MTTSDGVEAAAETHEDRRSRRGRRRASPPAGPEPEARGGILRECWADLRGRPRSWTQPSAWDAEERPQTDAPGPGWERQDMERLQRRYWSS